MEDNMGDGNIIIALDEKKTSQVGIEDRIKKLQAVTAMANQRQQRRRFKNKSQGDNGVVKGSVNNGGSSSGGGGASGEERVKNCKRDINHLAKALEMALDSKKTDDENFFDCNICLVVAKEPIVTCCGHLFCSSCYDKVPYVDSFSKECPTCKGEVNDSNLKPVYGNEKKKLRKDV